MLPELIEPWFIFSLIWSVGASCDNDGRKKFDTWLRSKIKEDKLKMPLPEQGLVYDYKLDDEGLFVEEDDSKENEENSKIKAITFSFCDLYYI
jgi:dynein heavy chain, axonemal